MEKQKMEKAPPKAKPGTLEDLLTIDDLMKILKVPRTTVKMKVALGEIPSIKIGRHRRFIPEDVQKWLKKQSA